MALNAGGTSSAVRLRIGAQVALVILVAAGCAYVATWLAARPGLARQFDWTAERSNTLPDELAEIVEALPQRAKIETFLRPLDAPFTEVSQNAIARVRDFLFVLAKGREDQLAVVHWSLDDIATAKTRLAELELREDNVIVISCGAEKTLLRLYRDVAEVDVGNPDPRQFAPARIASFRPEEAFALALKRVSSGAPARILFSSGHGEREFASPGEGSLFELARALAVDGFAVGAWDSSRAPDVPADCAVLAIADPRQAFGTEELDAVRRFLARGGRLFTVPSSSDASFAQSDALHALLAESGIQASAGRVAAPFREPSGAERVGDARVATLTVPTEGLEPRHPVTESLWRAKRRLVFPSTRAFAKSGTGPADAAFAELVRAPRNAWIDRPTPAGLYAWVPDVESEELGPVPICVAVSYLAPSGRTADDERSVTRVLALGSADAVTDKLFAQNGDFALNAFNWLAARDWRLSIPPRSNEPVRIDLAQSSALPWFNRLAIVGLPLVCALLGVVLFLRRRS
ncbi:MAG: Gldg family protein [Planctomycetes bacterium]|nr:Gldg family protein [Planctomycetota bacterium]